MADPHHYRLLLATLGRADGPAAWLEVRRKLAAVDLTAADLTGRRLRGYDLGGIQGAAAIFRNADLAGADLSGAQLPYADLWQANLDGALLRRALLGAASLCAANLSDASLDRARLRKARLACACLTGADLRGTDLTGADLRDACLRYACLTGAVLDRADVEGADLTGAVLDPGAAGALLHYDRAVTSAWRYPEPAWPRLARPPRFAVDPPDLPPEAECRASGRNGDDDSSIDSGNDTKGNREGQILGRLDPAWIPIREVEPDLSTPQGCCLVLGVTLDASPAEVVRAFRTRAMLFHPDKVGHLDTRHQELATREFCRLRQAYEVLTRQCPRPMVGIVWPEGLSPAAAPMSFTTADFERLARLNPVNPSIFYNLACRYFEEGRHELAQAAFERVLMLNPGDGDAYYNLVMSRLLSEVVLPNLGTKA